jgi:hypothetical protein
MNIYIALAYAIFIFHWLYIIVVVGGLLCILIGWIRGWSWTRNFTFRLVHLVMMGLVVAEVGLGWACVLTIWERDLRVMGGDTAFQGDFINEWAYRLFGIDWPLWVWDLGYYAFGGLIFLLFVLHPPRRPRWRCRRPPHPAATPVFQPPHAPVDGGATPCRLE